MKITIIGAGGNIGQRITREAADRDHELHLITSKEASFFQLENNNITTEQVDIFDTEKLSTSLLNSDVVISAYAPPHENTDLLIEASKSLVQAAKNTGTRLIAVGGAGSLKVNEDTLLVDTPSFPEEYKAIATSHLTVLETIYRSEKDLIWTNVSPSAYIFEGERTSEFKIGGDYLIINEKGESSISMEDFAIGVLDEVNNRTFSKRRFTLGY